MRIVNDDKGFRPEWETMNTFKLVIFFGGLFWAAFTLVFGLYNYCGINKPPPAISFDEALCMEEEALMASQSQPATAKSSATISSRST